MKCSLSDPTAKFVLVCLANYAGEDGHNAFPSVRRLVKDTELSERTIRTKLEWLTRQGYLTLGDQSIAAAYAKRRDRVTICYDLNLRGASNAPRADNGVQTTATGCISQQERGATDDSHGVQDVHPIRHKNPSIETLSARAGAQEGAAPRREGEGESGMTSRSSVPTRRSPEMDRAFEEGLERARKREAQERAEREAEVAQQQHLQQAGVARER